MGGGAVFFLEVQLLFCAKEDSDSWTFWLVNLYMYFLLTFSPRLCFIDRWICIIAFLAPFYFTSPCNDSCSRSFRCHEHEDGESVEQIKISPKQSAKKPGRLLVLVERRGICERCVCFWSFAACLCIRRPTIITLFLLSLFCCSFFLLLLSSKPPTRKDWRLMLEEDSGWSWCHHRWASPFSLCCALRARTSGDC